MASSRYKDKDAGVVLSFNGQWISWTHTVVAYGMSIFTCPHCIEAIPSNPGMSSYIPTCANTSQCDTSCLP